MTAESADLFPVTCLPQFNSLVSTAAVYYLTVRANSDGLNLVSMTGNSSSNFAFAIDKP